MLTCQLRIQSPPTENPPVAELPIENPESPTENPPVAELPIENVHPTESLIEDVPTFVPSLNKHKRIREEADVHYRINAERMQLKYAKAKRKKIMTFSVGDFVSVRIPRIDRTSTDSHRLLCTVIEKLGSKHHLYRLK